MGYRAQRHGNSGWRSDLSNGTLMKLITDDACAFLTNQVSGFLTEIGYPISIQSRHLVYAVEQGWIIRQGKISQSGREYFLYRDDHLMALANSEAFRDFLLRMRDESRHYSALIGKGIPQAEAKKQAFRSFNF